MKNKHHFLDGEKCKFVLGNTDLSNQLGIRKKEFKLFIRRFQIDFKVKKRHFFKLLCPQGSMSRHILLGA